MLYAAVDIGSNSIRHIVVDINDGVLGYVESSSNITRITEGMGLGDSELGKSGIDRSLAVIKGLKQRLDKFDIKAENRMIFATESLRQATNSHDVINAIERDFGQSLKILSGKEEACAGFAGARSAFPDIGLLFDLGGGSLEISGENESFSFPLGAVRLTNAFEEDYDAASAAVREKLSGINFPKGVLAGIGGTSSSIVMMLDHIPVNQYHPVKVNGRQVRTEELEELMRRVKRSGKDKSRITGLEPARADIILAGMTVIKAVLEIAGAKEYIHSECGIMWGLLALSLRQKGLNISRISFNN